MCAALSSFWPAVAPDITRSFWPSISGDQTVVPLTDTELGFTGKPGWDGEEGPIIFTEGSNDLVSYAESIGKSQGRDVTWRIAEKPAAKNYFLVGDAVSVLDPSSSHGALKAIMSGIMAGHLIPQMEYRNHVDVQDYYLQWILTWFESDVERLKALYNGR